MKGKIYSPVGNLACELKKSVSRITCGLLVIYISFLCHPNIPNQFQDSFKISREYCKL